jgi:hypothetical protein
MKKITLLLAATIASVSTFAQAVQMIPLFEVFTSSTCGPCAAGNTNLKNILTGKPTTDYVLIKYQQDFPGTGDPYATAETVAKRSAPYSINSIPRMEINGGWDSNAGNFTNAIYTSSRAVTALYDMNGTYYVNPTTKKVTVDVAYRSLGTVTGPKLYVAVIENITTKNKKTNGETQFENVVKKMLPNQSGTALTASTSWKNTSLTFQFAGSYRLPANGQVANHINDATENSVEEFTDLRVIAWIQGSDKKVYQSYNLLMNAATGVEENLKINVKNITTYPNPATDAVNIALTSEKDEKVSFMLTSIDGRVAQSFDKNVSKGNNTIELNTSEFANGTYFLSVIDEESNSYTTPIIIVR